MALIGIDPIPSIEVIQAQLKIQMQIQMNMSFKRITQDFKDLFNQVWNHPDLTPQQVMDAFGADAAQLFILAGGTQNYLNAIVPGTVTEVPPKAFVINEDGTVTIGS